MSLDLGVYDPSTVSDASLCTAYRYGIMCLNYLCLNYLCQFWIILAIKTLLISPEVFSILSLVFHLSDKANLFSPTLFSYLYITDTVTNYSSVKSSSTSRHALSLLLVLFLRSHYSG
jgi:hypothetical protein